MNYGGSNYGDSERAPLALLLSDTSGPWSDDEVARLRAALHLARIESTLRRTADGPVITVLGAPAELRYALSLRTILGRKASIVYEGP